MERLLQSEADRHGPAMPGNRPISRAEIEVSDIQSHSARRGAATFAVDEDTGVLRSATRVVGVGTAASTDQPLESCRSAFGPKPTLEIISASDGRTNPRARDTDLVIPAAGLSSELTPKICAGEVESFAAAAVEHGLHHVEREALCHRLNAARAPS